MKTIADRIKFLRGAVSRRAFATTLGIQESTLRNYESGASLPNSDLLHGICKILRVSPVWLLMGEGPMRTNETDPSQGLSPFFSPQLPGQRVESCSRCAKLEAELEEERKERREVSAENRRLWAKNEQISAELSTIKEENATLRARCGLLEKENGQSRSNFQSLAG